MLKILLKEIKSLLNFDGLKLLFVGLPIALIFRLINKFFLIRMMFVSSERIGEFVINPAIYLLQKENKINVPKQKYIDLFYMNKRIINNQWYLMLKRKINILPYKFLEPIDKAQKKLDVVFNTSEKYLPLSPRRFKFHYFDKLPHSKNNIKFNSDEIKRGQSELFEKFGIGKEDKFVCFLIRDQAFLKKMYPNQNFDYHEYRNIDSDKFIEAAKALSERGYYVFRMGRIQEKVFDANNSKIIDYAHSDKKNDFLDIYLSAHCTFFSTTLSGLDNLLPIFNVPTVFIPLNLYMARQYNNYLISTRTFVDQNGNKMSLKNLFKKDLLGRQKKKDFDQEKVIHLEPDSEQIKNLVIEMDDHIINSKPYTDYENYLNEKFWNMYSHYYNIDKRTKREIEVNGKLKVLSRFDINFLTKNHEWFLDNN